MWCTLLLTALISVKAMKKSKGCAMVWCWASRAVFPEQLQLIPVTLDQSARAWFHSEKRLCKNGTFLLSRSGRSVLAKSHLLTSVTKISFYGFPALVSTAESREL